MSKNLALQAVNGSRIPTFGTKLRQVKLGRKSYAKEFIIADIECPIIGWDFLKAIKLSLIWEETEEIKPKYAQIQQI